MKKIHIAIDFGTTNTVVAFWNHELDAPNIIMLNSICRNGTQKKEVDDSYTIPTCVFLRKPGDVYKFPFKLFFRRMKSKTRAAIGMKAIDMDGGLFKKRFVDKFKAYLGKNSFQNIGKLDKWSYNSEEITRIFLKELFSVIKKELNLKVASVSFCVPVDFYEFYRARLNRIASKLNVESIKTIDEPVAAALGYGLNISGGKNILVVDFGGGTLDIALMHTKDSTSEQGTCMIVAKEGAPIGGNLIDAWIVEELCKHYSYNFDRLSKDPKIQWWYRILLSEACRIKEHLFLKKSETFYLMPSTVMKQYMLPVEGDIADLHKPTDITRDQLIDILESNGLYTILDNIIDSVITKAAAKGVKESQIDEVIMVGGSTLLPKVYSLFEKRFTRGKVRAWQPFNAVAFGAAAFEAGVINKHDHITHDYALLTYDKKTHEPEYNVIVPQGTEYPTPKHFWRKQFVPTCALGEPESIFKLVVCEIGRSHTFNQEFVWDDKGELHSVNPGDDNLIVPLNESDPTMGYLQPPHFPSDKRARLEILFMVNENKWLCASVIDLKTGKTLFDEKTVIRLK